MADREENRHELIIPNDDISFKMFLFEGKDGNYFRDWHWHRSVEIFAVIQGELDFFLDEMRLHLGPGQFVLVNSNEIHSIHALHPNETVVLQIPVNSFRRYYVEDSFICFFHSRPDTDEEVMRLIREMYGTYLKKELGYDLAVQSLFYQLLYLLVLNYRNMDADRREMLTRFKNRNRLSDIMDYIKDNYSRGITLKHLGNVFGYSPSYISRMFQKYAGCGFKKYLENLRLEHAFQDLLETNMPLETIAAVHGFPDRKALSKAFREKYHMTPRQFRNDKNCPKTG